MAVAICDALHAHGDNACEGEVNVPSVGGLGPEHLNRKLGITLWATMNLIFQPLKLQIIL